VPADPAPGEKFDGNSTKVGFLPPPPSRHDYPPPQPTKPRAGCKDSCAAPPQRFRGWTADPEAHWTVLPLSPRLDGSCDVDRVAGDCRLDAIAVRMGSAMPQNASYLRFLVVVAPAPAKSVTEAGDPGPHASLGSLPLDRKTAGVRETWGTV
jgi:hypothetical protein